ncbi:hypothetical protein [Thermaurantiacus sp.]
MIDFPDRWVRLKVISQPGTVLPPLEDGAERSWTGYGPDGRRSGYVAESAG